MINISMRKIHFAHPRTSDTASTYVGDVNELWVDDTNSDIIRRGDGSTAGGIIVGGVQKTGTAPATSKGAIGDTKGTIIMPGRDDLEISGYTYMYYCYRDFPRTTDYTVEVKDNANGNAFKLTTLFANWPNDIYEGVRVWTTDANGAKDNSVDWVEQIADLGGDTYIVTISSHVWTAGQQLIFEYSTHSSYGVNIWKRQPFEAWSN